MLEEHNTFVVCVSRNGVSVYVGECTIEKVKELNKWKMIFTADEMFYPEISHKVFKEKATGFSNTFSISESDTSVINLCKGKINEFIGKRERVELNLKKQDL